MKYRLQADNIWFDRNQKIRMFALLWKALEASRCTTQNSYCDLEVRKLPLIPPKKTVSSPKVADSGGTWELVPEAHRLLFQSHRHTWKKQISLSTVAHSGEDQRWCSCHSVRHNRLTLLGLRASRDQKNSTAGVHRETCLSVKQRVALQRLQERYWFTEGNASVKSHYPFVVTG